MEETFIGGLIKRIRNGLFLAPSRSYGEQYIEPFVRKKYNLKDPASNDHDATDQNSKRYDNQIVEFTRFTESTKPRKIIKEKIIDKTKRFPYLFR